MSRAIVLPCVLVWAATWLACTTAPRMAPNTGAERAQILAELQGFHEQQQQAHFEGDAELFVSMFADPLLMVKDGEVRTLTRAESRRANQAYFDSTTFLAWDDIAPPIVHVSQDGTMAWRLVQKRVRALGDDDNDGIEEEGETIFAWMEAWERLDGVWRLMIATSTERIATATATEPTDQQASGKDVPEDQERNESDGE